VAPALPAAVAASAVAETNPRTSWRASKAFRVQLIGELARRALCESIVKAGGEAL
jgi:xanthine dehydrogenase FAD-binding subunit